MQSTHPVATAVSQILHKRAVAEECVFIKKSFNIATGRNRFMA